MDRYDIFQRGLESAAKIFSQKLLQGEVVIAPTETVYGLCARVFDDSAMKKVRQIKKIPSEKRPFILLVSSVEMAEKYAIMNETAKKLAKHFWPGPLTLVLPLRDFYKNTFALAGKNTAASFRVSSHTFVEKTFEFFEEPYVSTSANITGESPVKTFEEALDVFAVNQPSSFFDEGANMRSFVSTLVDCSGEKIQILREGAIFTKEILSVFE